MRSGDLTFSKVLQFARLGYQPCQMAIEEVGVHLAHGMADLINVFNPEMVVIGGELAEGQDLLLPIDSKKWFLLRCSTRLHKSCGSGFPNTVNWNVFMEQWQSCSMIFYARI